MMAKETGIFKMFSWMMEGRAARAEERRLIERERGMLDTEKFVLVSEFNSCMSGDEGAGRPTFLELQALGRGSLFWNIFDHESRGCGRYRVSFDEMKEPSRLSFKGKTFSSVDMEHVLSRNPGAQDSPGLCRYVRDMDLLWIRHPELEEDNVFFQPLIYFEAASLGMVINCWEETAKNNFFGRAERGSVYRGQGRVMIDFWKAVNALSDYSEFFPVSKHFGGHGERKKERESASVPVLVPALGGV